MWHGHDRLRKVSVPALEALEPRLLLAGNPLLSEFMADNVSALPDGDGNYEDWVEIHNPTSSPIDLGGWYLSDDPSNLRQWRFPSLTIPPGGYGVVFASGEDDDDYVDAGGHLHTTFALDAVGESVILVKPDGETIAHAYLHYPDQLPDVSYGITGFTTVEQTLVSSADPVRYHVPTSGEDATAWAASGYNDASWASTITVDAAGVLITEIGTGEARMVEIQNVSDGLVDTAGWQVLANDAGAGSINHVHDVAWALPDSMAPGAVRYRTDDVGDHYWGSGINWEAEGPGWAMLVGDAGDVKDFVAWGYTAAEIAGLSIDYGGFEGITVAGQWTGDGAAVGTVGGGEPTTGFVAFNDHVRGAGTHTNATSYAANGTASGFLKDIETGEDLDARLTVTQNGTRYEGLQGVPAPGTDAYDVFNGYVDFGSASNSSLAVSGGDHYTLTLTGLDTGDAVTYTFHGSAVRGKDGYTNRWTLVTLEGAESATAGHSAGDGVIVLSDTQIALWTGENHRSGQGFVASWTDIDPGPDGEFSIVSNQYRGSVPTSVNPGGVADGSKGYGISGIRLEEEAPSGPLSWLRRVGNTDGDTGGDFVRTSTASQGEQNTDMTVPFGTVVPARMGVGFHEDQPQFGALIRTDVGEAMHGTNASLWARIEFEGGQLAAYDTLTLRMKYDDGFIAYLNGERLTRRNAPDWPAHDSAANDNRPNDQAVVFKDIDVSWALDLLATDRNVLAIHGLNCEAGDGDFLIVPELVVSGTSFDAGRKHFTSPTPREPNGDGGGYPGIKINEIHYDPPVRTELVEFVELYNGGADEVDLSGWYLDGGIDYVFPAGTKIAADGYVVVTQDPADFQAKFGRSALGPWTGRLGNDGDEVILRSGDGQRIDEVGYRLGFPWPTTGDLPGRSIELVNPSLDNDLGGNWRPSPSGPTPGARNGAYGDNTAPQMRQAKHTPKQPVSGEDVTVTVKVTDPDGVESVTLHYQVVDPGSYIELGDTAYQTSWTDVAMADDGLAADEEAGDGVYTVVLSGSLQAHRRLMRYRITATDGLGKSMTAPYPEDPAGNFAYFCYDGVPDWTGADRPGATPVTYSSEVLTQVPVYQFITKRQSHLNAMHVPYRSGQAGQELPTTGTYGGSDYLWRGTLVYEGEVYDHVEYRARGGCWRYAMGKNMWKFDFTRGHSFQARDDYGREYGTTWDKLNFSACIQQGNYWHRGEQGMFEAAGFKLFNLMGVEAPKTHWVHFRLIEGPDETGPDQYSGDFQGLYMVIEQMDGRFLDEHDLPDGNLYKMEGHNGTLNNQGPTAVSNRSDLNAFKQGYYYDPNPSVQWWRDNVELEKYYSYRCVVEGIHHGDIAYGKNWFFYLDPETDLWSMLPWDLDLTWANNMYGNGNDCFRNQGAIFSNSSLFVEFQNRLREFYDLLYNPEQMGLLLDEMAGFIDDPDGGLSLVDADRAMWDYNPILASSYVNSSKAGHGRFYQRAATKDFPGMVQIMTDYVASPDRGFATGVADANLPNKPTITYVGPGGFPVNQLTFQASPFSDGTGTFAAMEWRCAEVTDPTAPAYDPDEPINLEMTAVWESGELTTYGSQATVAPGPLEVGHAYRVRVRMKDSTGRWSRWSDPIQFVASRSTDTPLTRSLRVTEIMYNPADDENLEFIELRNTGQQTLDLAGVTISDAVTFSFAGSGVTSLGPDEYVVIARNVSAFEGRYDTTGLEVVGPYEGSLANSQERIVLADACDGVMLDFEYEDWYGLTDGDGYSLTIRDAAGDEALWDSKAGWRPSFEPDGTPGQSDAGPDPGDVIITEVLAHTDDAPGDRIELHNTTGQPIDISGWFLSDSANERAKYRIGAGTILGDGEYVVFTQRDHFGVGFGLSEFGDDVYLSSSTGGQPGGYREHVDFGASPNGVSIGLHVKSTGATDFTLLRAPTLGWENQPPRIGDLVIHEVMYHPADPTQAEIDAGFDNDGYFEFVELYNCSGGPLDLREFWVGEGIGFTFGWYGADRWSNELWTLEAGATAEWQATLAPGTYEVQARWDVTDGEDFGRVLDSLARYEIVHKGGSSAVTIDQNDNTDPSGWVSLGSYAFDGAAEVRLARGTDDPDEWTIADQVKFVRSGGEVVVDNASEDFSASECDLVSLPADGYAVLVRNRSAFDLRYDIDGNGIPVAGEYTSSLANTGEKIKIRQATNPQLLTGYIPYFREDYVNYGEALPWPPEPDGTGPSLARVSAEAYGNDAGNWSTGIAGGTPGAANVYLDTTPPGTPTHVAAANVGGVQVHLDWSASADPQSGVDHYVIYRNGLQAEAAATAYYVDTDVLPGVPYAYEVSAVNLDDYESARSAPAGVTIPGIESLAVVDENTLRLVFTEPLVEAAAENKANYSLSGGTVVLARLEADQVTVTLTTSRLESGQSYTVTVNGLATTSDSAMPPDARTSFVFQPEGAGTILREYWLGIAGSAVSDLTGHSSYPDGASGEDYRTSLEGPTGWLESYGARLRGYLHPPVTGNYRFWIAGDDSAELYLSTDASPAHKQLIAGVPSRTDPDEWDRHASQQSGEVYLQAGLRYYVEVLHKQGASSDHLAVRWQLPGGVWEDPVHPDLAIPGNRLSPYEDTGVPRVTVDKLTTHDGSPRLTGTVDDPNATIAVTANEGHYAGTNHGDGTWSLADDAIDPPLADGVYDVAVAATSPQQKTGYDETTGELTVDTIPPAVSVDPRTTEDSTPALSGTVDDPDATITVTVAGLEYVAVNRRDGTWTLPDGTIGPPLGVGTHDVVVEATDPAGNVAADATTNELTIEPPAPIVTVDPLITPDRTPALAGTVSDPDAAIVVTIDGRPYDATNQGDDTWTLADDAISPPLADGTYDVQVAATSLAGKTGRDWTADELVIDNVLPVVTVEPLATDDATPLLTGTVDDPGASIVVTVAGRPYEVGHTGFGTWVLPDDTIDPPLLNSAYDVQVTATDRAGNVGTDATTDELFVDTTAPSAPANLVAQAISSSRIDLAWAAAEDPESGVARYAVYRNGLQVGTTERLFYSDTGLDQTQTYRYRVSAISTHGFEGGLSGSAEATPRPGVVAVHGIDRTHLLVTFGKAVKQTTAETTANYGLTDGAAETVPVVAALRDAEQTHEVTLSLSAPLVEEASYVLTVAHVEDLAGNAVADDSSVTFLYRDIHPDLLAWWTFDEGAGDTALDVTGNDRHLDVIGAAWTDGILGGAIRLDGSGSHAVDEDGEAYLNGLTELTVAMWIRADATGSDNGFFTTGPAGNPDCLSLRHDEVGWSGGKTNTFKVFLWASTGNTNIEGAANTQTTDWQHVSVTWRSGGGMVLYLDGELQDLSHDGDAVSGSLDGATQVRLGVGERGTSYAWAGEIDDVRIYRRQLNAQEIDVLVRAARNPTVVGLERNDGADRPPELSSLALQFSHDVSGSLDAADLSLHNESTDTPVDLAGAPLSYDWHTNTARWDLSGVAVEPGYHTLVLAAAGVTSPQDRPLDGNGDGDGGDDYRTTFLLALPGDADRDGEVSRSDFLALRSNFGRTDAGWSAGDFSGNGIIDAADYLALKRNAGAMVRPALDAPLGGGAAASSPSGEEPAAAEPLVAAEPVEEPAEAVETPAGTSSDALAATVIAWHDAEPAATATGEAGPTAGASPAPETDVAAGTEALVPVYAQAGEAIDLLAAAPTDASAVEADPPRAPTTLDAGLADVLAGPELGVL